MPLVRAAPTARHYRSGPAPAGQTNNGRFRNSTSTTEYERRLATAVPPSGLNNPTERSLGTGSVVPEIGARKSPYANALKTFGNALRGGGDDSQRLQVGCLGV